MQDQSKTEAVARRAYEIWEAEGCPEGRHEAHWTMAEAELRSAGSHTELKYGEMEQPGGGHPSQESGLLEANQQAGEGNPGPSAHNRQQRVQRDGVQDSRAATGDQK